MCRQLYQSIQVKSHLQITLRDTPSESTLSHHSLSACGLLSPFPISCSFGRKPHMICCSLVSSTEESSCALPVIVSWWWVPRLHCMLNQPRLKKACEA